MVFEIHVIIKRDISMHETLTVDIPMPRLAASSIRIRTSLIGITSNNFTYATLGDMLQWWNTWPVPIDGPAPYNNRDEWGIVPAWGFARVLESTVDAIQTGGLLYGFWPTSSHPFDMRLEPAEPKGHFREISEHRQGLGSIYNHYNLVDESAQSEEFRAWFANVYPPWNGGYVLNRFTYPTDFKPVHPLGQGAGEWTDQDADLSSAMVVSLSAASRTARSFTWNLARNRKPGNGPLALLQATSVPQSLTPAFESEFEIKAVNYDSLVSQEVTGWIAGFQPKRVVVADFGGPPEVTEKLLETIKSALSESTVISNLLVGAQPKVVPQNEMIARMGSQKKWGTVQLNTTGAVDAGIAAEGAEHYHQENVSAFKRSLKENIAGDLELAWGSGVGGANGVEKAWEDLAKGTLSFNKAWVYRLE
ncbi:hypothetical protein CGRA01v4_13433 [Colletotrichum graminicola]|uniref:Uncharacterized protein n=1 Tax=Colletotrichum graminicola (strain M1.001 / M2 / FGSC 10212) TaxID=645133 RepID=E3QI33_COLGM|nr:uncharacterized protein GLRG_05665 [Colletotrichum graminicola M1.001]EFQ30521.1 hypothetical protein GLRG_05665 [Colletotrichum graminicola M1.001]WDK22143.1 hypothetical protein CGRA01v4_13433 [Colletotrichum graminicola]